MASFAVACGHEITAEAAAETLRDGGTAVDAAIAGALTAMVAEPVLAGFLGGGFLMVRAPNGRAHLLDMFVRTPRERISGRDLDFRAIHANFGTALQEFHVGAATIATPGLAPGLVAAHERFGRTPFRRLVEPACKAARTGVEVTHYQSRLLEIVGAIYRLTEGARALFCSDDRLLRPGAVHRNPAFGDVLEEFAREGDRFVTEGEVGQALLAIAREGGHLTADDLRSHAPVWREPLAVERAGARVSINPPPSLGGALVAFGLSAAPSSPGPDAVLRVLAATSRIRVEAALDKNAAAGARDMLSPALLTRYRDEIAAASPASRGTTHISVIDRDGMGAALTLSNGEGAGMIVPGTGIMPNNMMGEADLLPDGLQAWEPATRMASMMAPLIVDWPDGQFAMLGSGGSNRIRSALLQILFGIIDRAMPLADSIEAARMHAEGGADAKVDFEDVGGDRFRERILRECPQATPWPERSMFFGGAHGALSRRPSDLVAAGDPRRAGVGVTG